MDYQHFMIFGATVIGIGIVVKIIHKRLRYFNFNKEVESTYWGHYEGTAAEPLDHKKIKLPKISFKEVITIGGASYSKGKAVKSAKAN